jgi:serine/threonine-protein kinase
MYIALEPFVRRRWPDVLIGWSRLLAGKFRDPLVGRDLLIGCGAAVLMVLLHYLRYPLSHLLGLPVIRPSTGDLWSGLGTFNLLAGGRAFIAEVVDDVFYGVTNSLSLGFLLFLSRVLLKKTWAAIALVALIFTFVSNTSSGEPSFLYAVLILMANGLLLFVWFRLGFLALSAALLGFRYLIVLPLTTQLSAWYSWIGLTGLTLFLAFVLYAFHTSLGGQPMFGRASLED